MKLRKCAVSSESSLSDGSQNIEEDEDPAWVDPEGGGGGTGDPDPLGKSQKYRGFCKLVRIP